MDPYVYSNINILINKLNIKDQKELIDVEAQLITFYFMSYIHGQENSAQSIFIKLNVF